MDLFNRKKVKELESSIKELEDCLSHRENVVRYLNDSNSKLRIALKDKEELLELEKLKSTYWKIKFQNPDIEPELLGDEELMRYVRE